MSIRSQIQKLVEAEDLVFLGIVGLRYESDYLRYRSWIDQGKHAEMSYLELHPECRSNPVQLLSGARSAVIFALPYYQGDALVNPALRSHSPVVAQYARFRDYHGFLKECGERIGKGLQDYSKQRLDFRVVVDSAPVLERALAAKTSRGFIGKNTCFIHPSKGSFLLLAELIMTLDMESDSLEKSEACGACTACQVSCPTGALNKDYELDARKCLAYWTIENRGPIPEMFWPYLKEYYFGCDICQLVCPYNKQAPVLPKRLKPRVLPSLFEIATMDQAAYEKWFGGTPMTRAKRNGLRRNALIAMVVTGDLKLQEAMTAGRADDASPVRETLEQIERFLSSGSYSSV